VLQTHTDRTETITGTNMNHPGNEARSADLRYSDGIAAARTMIALSGPAGALQRRMPDDWEVTTFDGNDFRGMALRGANMLVPFHEVYAVRNGDGREPVLAQTSYVPFIALARHRKTGGLGFIHWMTYTEDPEGVPGKYGDGKLAQITRAQTFKKDRPGETRVCETFDARVGDDGVHLSLEYQQGGKVVWATAKEPNIVLHAASDPSIERWYQEDQVMDVIRSDPLNINRVSRIELDVKGEQADVFDGSERVIAVVIQRPYMRQVFVPG
jgi:hypothetical protein